MTNLIVNLLRLWTAVALLIGLCAATGCQIEKKETYNVHPKTNENAVANANSRLHSAAASGDTAAVKKWLGQRADINARDADGRTPIMAATRSNRPETVKLLIEAGADINLRDNISDNPLLYAGAEGMLDIVKLLIDAGADPALTNRFGGTALIPASERGHAAVVEELLQRSKVNVNHINNLGWTALMEAIVLGRGGEAHQTIVKLLIEHGADVNIPDKDAVSPLTHAKARGFDAMADILAKAGAR